MNQIICVLVNGNINRLRAFASSLALAEYLNFKLKVVWLDEPHCISDAEELFSRTFFEKFFISEAELSKILNIEPKLIPKGLEINNPEVFSIRGGQRVSNFI